MSEKQIQKGYNYKSLWIQPEVVELFPMKTQGGDVQTPEDSTGIQTS